MSYEHRQTAGLAVSLTFLILTLVVVPLRCYARRIVIPRLALEDWLMIVAQVLLVLCITGNIVQVVNGLGRHDLFFDLKKTHIVMFLLFLESISYAITMALARISIGLLLLRLMANKVEKGIVWFTIAINAGVGIFFVVWQITNCSPVWAYWHPELTGLCRDQGFLLGVYIHSGTSIFSDWTLSLLPIYVLYRSNLDRKTRIGCSVVLSLGAVASLSTILRFTGVKDSYSQGLAQMPFNLADVVTWSIAEQGLAIVAGCLACLRPLFIKNKIRTRQATMTEGSRGRPGRPVQPGDTALDWDPGLTIGSIHELDHDEEAEIGNRRSRVDEKMQMRHHLPAEERERTFSTVTIDPHQERYSLTDLDMEGLVHPDDKDHEKEKDGLRVSVYSLDQK